jgi:hypothetical protein
MKKIILSVIALVGFVAIPAFADVSTYTYCADEGGVCSFEGVRDVRYGAGENWVELSLTDGTACTNEVFTDPIEGTVKTCELKDVVVVVPPVVVEAPILKKSVASVASTGSSHRRGIVMGTLMKHGYSESDAFSFWLSLRLAGIL